MSEINDKYEKSNRQCICFVKNGFIPLVNKLKIYSKKIRTKFKSCSGDQDLCLSHGLVIVI